MIDFYSKDRYGFDDLVELVRVLRAPDGCPWDRVQTHSSIRRNFIEEVYEACEAIDAQDPDALREELGDVLLHVVFHAGIEADAGRFTIDDVCDTVVKKMVSRHPALFGGDDQLDWDAIKRRERGQTTLYEELDSVARSLPALWRAEKLLKKAEKAGVLEPSDGWQCLRMAADPVETVGQLLFEAADLARQLGVDPELALHRRCDAFLAQAHSDQTGRESLKVQAEPSAQNVKENET